jgi:hypothetical protein
LGTDTKHWKTEDRGKTWDAFETPVEPAIRQQLSFHANRPNHILFTGFQCNKKRWQAMDCREEVSDDSPFYLSTQANVLFGS